MDHIWHTLPRFLVGYHLINHPFLISHSYSIADESVYNQKLHILTSISINRFHPMGIHMKSIYLWFFAICMKHTLNWSHRLKIV